jgi:hypothetical protein
MEVETQGMSSHTVGGALLGTIDSFGTDREGREFYCRKSIAPVEF